MEKLTIIDGGYTIKLFEIKANPEAGEPIPMLHIVAENPNDVVTITYHRSTDGQTFTPHQETTTFTGYVHEPLYGLKVGEYLKITSNKVLSIAEIKW